MFYRQTELSSGLTVITEKIDTVRSVALGIWFAVGSRDESPAQAGMSHFMEHMMFKGTTSRSAAMISEAFDGLGAEVNAFTSKEYTCYHTRVVDEHLPVAFEVLSDMVVNSLFEDDACRSEREVVIEEIARTEDTPEDLVHEQFSRTLWPHHPIGLPILGNRETVCTFDHLQSVSFHKEHYVTGNCVVAAAGNVDHDELVGLVESYLHLAIGNRSKRPTAHSAGVQRLSVLQKDTEQSHICYGMATMHAHHEDRFVLSIIDSVLGGGMSSRLFQEIREKKGLAYSVYSFIALYQDTGQFTVYAGTRPSNTEKVISLIQEQFDRVRTKGITPDELIRAKNSYKGHLVLSLENTRSRMMRLGKNSITGGELLSVDELVSRIDRVSLEDVQRVAENVFSAERALALIGPRPPEELPCCML